MWLLLKEPDRQYKIAIIRLFGFFPDRVLLCCPCCPGTQFVDQAGLKLKEIQLLCLYLCLPSAGTKGMRHHSLARSSNLNLQRRSSLRGWIGGTQTPQVFEVFHI